MQSYPSSFRPLDGGDSAGLMLEWETEPEPGQQATERGSAASSDIVTEVKRMKLRLKPTRGETQVKVMSEEGADWLRMMGDKSKTRRWT